MIWVELLDERGNPTSRVRLGAKAKIGSGADCDLTVSHPSVSARHLEAEEIDGNTIRLRDLGSEAGTRTGVLRVGEADVPAPAVVRLGDLSLRLSISDRAQVSRGKARPFRPAVSWPLLLAAVALLASWEHLTNYSPEAWPETVYFSLGVLIMSLVWVGGWSLGNRVFRHPFSFSDHLGWLSVWMLVSAPLFLLGATLFQSIHNEVTGALNGLLGMFLVVVLLYLHIRVGSHWRRGVNLLIAAAIVFVPSSLGLLGTRTTATEQVEAALAAVPPLPAAFFVTAPVEHFIEDAGGILQELEALESPETSR